MAQRERGRVPCAFPAGSPYAAVLRMAGLRVTSARVATLRAAPGVLKEHGCLTPLLLHEACLRLGYAVHLSIFYRLLPDLAAAGLIPAQAIRLPASRMAGLSGAPLGDDARLMKPAAAGVSLGRGTA